MREEGRADGMLARTLATRAVIAAVALFALALAVSACGGTDESASSGAAPKELTIATNVSPPGLDPASADASFREFFTLAYDPLIVARADGSFGPGLATSWSYGPQNRSFAITLRRGVRFSDGTPLDADAVKRWIEYALRVPGGPATLFLGGLDTIDVTGPLSLTLRFSAPTPGLEVALSQLLGGGLIGNPKAIGTRTLEAQTNGAGPYMLDKAATVAGDHYVYVPNPNYWNKDAIHWKRVTLKLIANPNAALQALKTNQVQVALGQPAASIDTAARDGLRSVAPPTLLMGLGLYDRGGTLSRPLGDVRVRQAINYAIDRDAIAKVIGAGHGKVIDQMAAPGDDSYVPALEESYRYDPAKAKQLLAEAGYADGFTLPVTTVAIVEMDKLAQALAGQLARVGITLKVDVKPSGDAFAKALGGKAAPAGTIAFGRLPAAINYQLLWGPRGAVFNAFGSTDPRIEAAEQKLVVAPPDEVSEHAAEIQRVLVDDAWFAPVVSTPLVVLYRPDVTGVDASDKRFVINTSEIRPAS